MKARDLRKGMVIRDDRNSALAEDRLYVLDTWSTPSGAYDVTLVSLDRIASLLRPFDADEDVEVLGQVDVVEVSRPPTGGNALSVYFDAIARLGLSRADISRDLEDLIRGAVGRGEEVRVCTAYGPDGRLSAYMSDLRVQGPTIHIPAGALRA